MKIPPVDKDPPTTEETTRALEVLVLLRSTHVAGEFLKIVELGGPLTPARREFLEAVLALSMWHERQAKAKAFAKKKEGSAAGRAIALQILSENVPIDDDLTPGGGKTEPPKA